MSAPAWDQSSAEKAGAFIDLLTAREQDAERRANLWRRRCKLLLLVFVIMLLFAWHWIVCLISPSYIAPSEDDTRTLYLHTRHFFRGQTIDKLEARRTDYGTVEWMKKYPNGEWSQAFDFGPQ